MTVTDVGYCKQPCYILSILFSVSNTECKSMSFMCVSFFDSALSFKYVVEHQPIGHELFQEFCGTKPHLKKAIDFLDAVVCSSATCIL